MNNDPLRPFADALADKSSDIHLKTAWTALMFKQPGRLPAQDEDRVAGFEDALVSAVNSDNPKALDVLAACLRSNGEVAAAISKLVTVNCPAEVPKRVCESLLWAVSAAQLAWRMKRGAGSKSEFVNQVKRTLEDWGLVSPDLSISLSSDLDVNGLVRAFSDSVAEIKEIGLLLNVLSRLLGSGIDSDPLRVLRRTIFVPAIYVSPDPSTHAMRGRVISLKLSLIERGSGLIVSDPLTEGSRRFIRDDFIQALDDAKAAACHVSCKEWPKDCDLVWSLVNVDEQDRILEGNSIGLAGAIGMLHLLHETDPDQQVLCTGGVAPDGKLSPVGGISPKTIEAAAQMKAGHFRRWIVPQEHAATATNIAVALGLTGDQTESATTLRDAYDKATDLMGAVNAYLKELVTSVEKNANKFLPDRLQHRGFWEIRQRVNVVTDRKDLRRFREELERRRASGDAIDYRAYLPHRPRGELGEADDGQDREMPEAPESLDWDAQAADSSRFTKMVLLGDPGYGKSRLLQHEARRLANAAVQQLKTLPDQEGHATLSTIAVPILLRLPALAEQLPLSAEAAIMRPSNPASLSKAIVDCVVAQFGATWNGKGTSPLAVWLNDVLGEQRCVLLLDGWDEVPHALRSSLNDALNAFTSTFKGRVILSSRIVGYDYEPPNEWPELELQDFGPRQIRDFAVAWWPEKSDSTCQSAFLTQVNSSRSPTVAGLARIPLMLTLLARLFDERWTESGQAALPSRRTELYEACLKGLLRDWRKERSGKTVADREYVPTVRKLRTIALGLQLAGKQQFSFESVSNAAGVNSQDEERTTKIATDCEDWEDAGLLTWVVADEYVWLHRTFGEYLAARALSAHIEELGWDAKLNVGGVSENVQAVLDRKAWDPDWHHVLLLLAGLVPEEHLNDLLDIVERPKFDPALDAKVEFVAQLDEPPVWMICEQDDFFCHRLALAAQCSAEMSDTIGESTIEQLFDRSLSVFKERFAYDRASAPGLYRGIVATGRILAARRGETFFSKALGQSLSSTGECDEWELVFIGDVGPSATSKVVRKLVTFVLRNDESTRSVYALVQLALTDADHFVKHLLTLYGSRRRESSLSEVLIRIAATEPTYFDGIADAMCNQLHLATDNGKWYDLVRLLQTLSASAPHKAERIGDELLKQFFAPVPLLNLNRVDGAVSDQTLKTIDRDRIAGLCLCEVVAAAPSMAGRVLDAVEPRLSSAVLSQLTSHKLTGNAAHTIVSYLTDMLDLAAETASGSTGMAQRAKKVVDEVYQCAKEILHSNDFIGAELQTAAAEALGRIAPEVATAMNKPCRGVFDELTRSLFRMYVSAVTIERPLNIGKVRSCERALTAACNAAPWLAPTTCMVLSDMVPELYEACATPEELGRTCFYIAQNARLTPQVAEAVVDQFLEVLLALREYYVFPADLVRSCCLVADAHPHLLERIRAAAGKTLLKLSVQAESVLASGKPSHFSDPRWEYIRMYWDLVFACAEVPGLEVAVASLESLKYLYVYLESCISGERHTKDVLIRIATENQAWVLKLAQDFSMRSGMEVAERHTDRGASLLSEIAVGVPDVAVEARAAVLTAILREEDEQTRAILTRAFSRAHVRARGLLFIKANGSCVLANRHVVPSSRRQST